MKVDMNYNLVQREIKTLGEDLTELGEGIFTKAENPSPQAPIGIIKLVPDILAELTCIQQRLSALLNYIQGSS